MRDIRNVVILVLLMLLIGCIYFLKEQKILIRILAESHLELEGFLKETKELEG